MPAQPLSAFLRAANDTDDESRDERSALAQRRSEGPDITLAEFDDGTDNRDDDEWEDDDEEFDEDEWAMRQRQADQLRYESSNGWVWEPPGDDSPPEPDVCTREDGQPLFYSGVVNWVSAVTESGKTWLGLHAIAQEIKHGYNVIHLDYDRGRDSRSRLVAMGLTNRQVSINYTRLVPKGSILDNMHHFRKALDRQKPSLVLIESAQKAASMEGLDLIHDYDDLNEFNNRLTYPLAEEGICVIVNDHANPPERGMGRYSTVGVNAKLNDIDGAVYILQPVHMFRPGGQGKSLLWLAKNRFGHVRAASMRDHGYAAIDPELDLAGQLVADSTGLDEVTVEVTTPERNSTPPRVGGNSTRRRGRRSGIDPKAIKDMLEENPNISLDKIRERLGTGSKTTISNIVRELKAGTN